MKATLLCVLMLLTLAAGAATVTGPLVDAGVSAATTRVEFWPKSTPFLSGTNLVIGGMKAVQARNGDFTVSLSAGRYEVRFPPTTDVLNIFVPNDSETYQIATLATNIFRVITAEEWDLVNGGGISAATGTNIAAHQAKLATNGLPALWVAADTIVSNGLFAEISASAEGISATTATNIAAYQAQIATNGLTGGTSGALTNNDTRNITFSGDEFIFGDGNEYVLTINETVGMTLVNSVNSGFFAVAPSGVITGNGSGVTNIQISGIDATGTPSDSTYLRGDGTWATPAGGSGLDGEALADALASGTNSVNSTNFTGTANNMAFLGSNYFSTVYAGNVVGNANGLTNVLADRMSQHIAAYYVTNYTQDRSSIWVTGNGAAAVNGQYKVSFYNPDTFRGIWTNTASTNMILMNNPSNGPTVGTQPFVLAGTVTPDEFLYQENQELLGVRDDWVGGFVSDGMTDFTGTATLTWGSNAVRQLVVSSWALGGTNVGIVATNLIRVSLNGNDEQATRLNGKPFKTLYVASTNATSYDLIYIEPGYHKTKPFHMDNRNFHILGAGEEVCVVEVEHFQSGPDPFQSRAIVPWENCSVGGFTLTNGLIAFAQFEAPLGATNAWAHDLTIYPPIAIKYPDNTALNDGSGDQQQYFNVGVDVSRIGNDNRIERVKVRSGMRGINLQTTYSTSGTITIVDCEAASAPEYAGGSPNIWTNAAFMASNSTNVGGMMPISLSAKSPGSQAAHPFTLNIQGGKFYSLNGGTNVQAYVGGETQASRNASLWISRAYTNTVTINLSGIPRFYNGNTNTTSFAVLNESTNNSVTIAGYYTSNYVAQATNAVYQSVVAAGTQATSINGTETMNFGTTDPSLTIPQAGFYAVYVSASGVTSSSDTSQGITFQLRSNNVAVGPGVTYAPVDGGLSSLILNWSLSFPVFFSQFAANDTVALGWSSAGTSWASDYASISAIRLK